MVWWKASLRRQVWVHRVCGYTLPIPGGDTVSSRMEYKVSTYCLLGLSSNAVRSSHTQSIYYTTCRWARVRYRQSRQHSRASSGVSIPPGWRLPFSFTRRWWCTMPSLRLRRAAPPNGVGGISVLRLSLSFTSEFLLSALVHRVGWRFVVMQYVRARSIAYKR